MRALDVVHLATGQPNPAQVSNDHFGIIVGGLVTVLVALCSLAVVVIPLLVRAKRDASVARDQTANNHDMNLRDDMDGKHVQNGAKLDWLVAAVTYLLDRDQNGDTDTSRRRTLTRSAPDSGAESESVKTWA